MSESIEPPLSKTTEGRPTIVLLEDAYLYDGWRGSAGSWRATFSHVLPHDRGLHICNLMSINEHSLEEGLDALDTFLPSMQNVVLVSRGALVSLMAQYYLSSHSLAGLIMVNPVLMDSTSVLWKLYGDIPSGSTEHDFVERILTGKETQSLKLEPGTAPTLVIQSVQDRDFQKAANDVALLHNDPNGRFGEVLVHDMSETEDAMEAIDTICDWIDNRVLLCTS